MATAQGISTRCSGTSMQNGTLPSTPGSSTSLQQTEPSAFAPPRQEANAGTQVQPTLTATNQPNEYQFISVPGPGPSIANPPQPGDLRPQDQETPSSRQDGYPLAEQQGQVPQEPWLRQNQRKGLVEAINNSVSYRPWEQNIPENASGNPFPTSSGLPTGDASRRNGQIRNHHQDPDSHKPQTEPKDYRTQGRRELTITQLTGTGINPNQGGPETFFPRDTAPLPQGTLSLSEQGVLEADLFTLLDPVQDRRLVTHPNEVTATYVVTLGQWLPAGENEVGPVMSRSSLIEVLPDGKMPPWYQKNGKGNQTWVTTTARTKASEADWANTSWARTMSTSTTTTWGQVSKGEAEGGGCTIEHPMTNS